MPVKISFSPLLLTIYEVRLRDLSCLRTLSQSILSGGIKTKSRVLPSQLQESVDKLYALIENLLTWSNFQKGLMEYRPQLINFQDIIARNVALCIQNAQQKQITLRNSVQEQMPVYIDIHMVDAVIRNLLSNAIKFTNAGGTIEISATV